MNQNDGLTAAEVCQRHIDNLDRYRKGRRFRRGLTGAVAAAIYDLLTLTRNTDIQGRVNRSEFDEEMSRLRDASEERAQRLRDELR